MRARLSLFLLSAATLVFEINLTRLFAVAQFYHFAFMIVSLALLGFGASGTALALFPVWAHTSDRRGLGDRAGLSRLSLACGVCLLGSYLLINWLPFDSFSIAWDWRQAVILAVHYLALASPFFFSGLAVGILLTASPHDAGRTYSVNLLGSAAGCVLALAAPLWLGGEGAVTLSGALAALAALIADFKIHLPRISLIDSNTFVLIREIRGFKPLAPLVFLFCLYDLSARLIGWSTLPALELRLSPYKSLSYALQYPNATIIFQEWNAFSRVDVVQSRGVRSLPGLSYRYLRPPPPEHGLLVDADDLSPIVLPSSDPAFADYLPAAIAFQLRPDSDALILEPRGGLDVTTALAFGARRVTAVEANPLIVQAAQHVYGDPRVRVVIESDRSYIRRSTEQYDLVVLSLASSYHPIRSGAYSLAEDYRYTVESFQDALARLKPEGQGLFVVTRWLQNPPSEELRAFALAVTALERNGLDPAGRIVAFRGYNTATLLAKTRPFTAAELDSIRAFAADRAFDLIYAPGLRADESNRYNIQPEPIYYQAFVELLSADSRADWYANHPFDVEPPTDDHPFFGHFFKWAQAGQVLAELGKTWQPFGGAGYFVLLALLALALVMAAGLILLPAMRPTRFRKPRRSDMVGLSYFGLIGLAFLLVEIPLIQKFILYLGQPAYAVTAVLFTLLLFSGIGSQFSARVPRRLAPGILVALAFGLPFLLPRIFALTLGLSFPLRLGLTVLLLAPLGIFMGIPFPAGIAWLMDREANESRLPNESAVVPWAWAVNGAASVVSSVIAALLALSFGFSWVLIIGAACYAGAWLTVIARPARSPSPRQ